MRRAALILLPLLLAGCGRAFDLDQARLCRIALPALAPPEAEIRIASTSADPDGAGVTLRYFIPALPGARFAHCRFAPAPDTPARFKLVGLMTELGPLSDTRLYFLRRFWVETSEGFRADPEPIPESFDAPEVSPSFAYALQQGLNALPLAAIYALLACAYSLVYGLIGRLNLAFGEFAALGGYAALSGAALAPDRQSFATLALALICAVFAAVTHGAVAARLAFLPLARSSGQQALVATVGLALFLQEYLRLTQGAGLRWIQPLFATPFALARAGDFVVTLTPMTLLASALALAAALLMQVLMKHSRFGREWRAYSDDPLEARLLGVSPNAILVKTFALACALAGLSGATMTLFYGSLGYGLSTALGLKALIAAILGGIGSIGGAFLGGLAVGLIETGWSAAFPIEYRDLVVYGLRVALLMFRPGGFFGFGDLAPRQI